MTEFWTNYDRTVTGRLIRRPGIWRETWTVEEYVYRRGTCILTGIGRKWTYSALCQSLPQEVTGKHSPDRGVWGPQMEIIRREQDPVDGPELGSAGVPLQHPELVAEDEDLEVLGAVVPVRSTTPDEQTDEGADDEVEERPHPAIVLGGRPRIGVSDPHGRRFAVTPTRYLEIDLCQMRFVGRSRTPVRFSYCLSWAARSVLRARRRNRARTGSQLG